MKESFVRSLMGPRSSDCKVAAWGRQTKQTVQTKSQHSHLIAKCMQYSNSNKCFLEGESGRETSLQLSDVRLGPQRAQGRGNDRKLRGGSI